MSFANLVATPGYGQLLFIGRGRSVVDRTQVAEAETTAACFVLVEVPTQLI